ncbi:MAG: hypothetical protein ACKOFD_04980 [Actinomycetota bacterium]
MSCLVFAEQTLAANDTTDSFLAYVAPTPSIHYPFDTDLVDAEGGSTLTVMPACPANPCNSATSFGSDANGQFWTWTSTSTSAGGGFSILTNAVIGQNYTVALKFSFSAVTGWRKIIDYQNRSTDEGFYYYGGKMQFYPGRTGNEVYPANTVLDLVIVRDNGGTTGTFADDTFTVYGVGAANTLTQLIQYNDTTGESIPYISAGKTKLGFFYDDTSFTGEATLSGKVYDLRIWSNQTLAVSALNSSVLRPSAVTGIVVNPATQSVTVSWNAVTGATSYVASAGGQSCTATAPAITCTILGLTDGTSVTPTVQAIGEGGYSDAASASQAVTVGSTTTTISSTTTTTTTTIQPTTTSSSQTTLLTTQTTAGSASNPTVTPTSVGALTRTVSNTSVPTASVSGTGGNLPTTGESISQVLWTSFLMILAGCFLLQRQRRRVTQLDEDGVVRLLRPH